MRHALVCGASSGIGRETAIALAAQGVRVTALARRKDRLEALASEIGCDVLVGDLDDHDALVQSVKALEPFQLLINNTGGPKGGKLTEAHVDELRAAFHRHVLAAHLLTGIALPHMRAAGFGRIVNVLSTSVREPIPNLGVSNTIRAAMAGWAKTLSRELDPGITINNVLPGFTDTERLGQLKSGRAAREGVDPDKVHAAWLSQVPEGRLARPEETAGVVAFLCSDAGAYIRGVSLPVDGGRLRST
ncbi:MAG: SDR family oxidoreductase [Proteobacteria bacterium]|nr:SDR family oxidoreductase [Pseudomonadota bacterium]MCP4917997.1 SDR family oxidoreductase [Pseudomonadota bacterium]